jgi:CRP-like cAMP-binding protein
VLGEVLHQYPDVLRVLLDFFRTRLVTLLATTSPLFAPFTPAERESLIRMFRFVEIEAGATVIQQGEPSPGLFILLAGRMDVTVARGGAEVQLALLGAGDLLGEMSILTRGPAMASIRAAVKCWALLVPRQQFQGLVLKHPQMLDYVNDLAEQRRLENDATLAGKRPYSEGRLQVY